jgi:hypothetical protein
MFGAETKEKKLDRERYAAFWMQEVATLPVRNVTCAARRFIPADGVGERECIVVTCMDERNTHIDEALGFAPGEAEVYASGGGKIDIGTFNALFGERIDTATSWGDFGRPVSVFLTPHECSHDAALGCAAFGNDIEAQKTFFTTLKKELKERFPKAAVHVMALCTTTHKLREIDVDDGDAALASARAANAALNLHADDVAHAGHGIYIGDAYRAWVPARNAYFRLSAENPSLAGNAAIALTVMEHHSEVNLEEKPVVIHADYPRYANRAKSDSARNNINAALNGFLSQPAVAERIARGALQVVKTETEMSSWKGKLLE